MRARSEISLGTHTRHKRLFASLCEPSLHCSSFNCATALAASLLKHFCLSFFSRYDGTLCESIDLCPSASLWWRLREELCGVYAPESSLLPLSACSFCLFEAFVAMRQTVRILRLNAGFFAPFPLRCASIEFPLFDRQ